MSDQGLRARRAQVTREEILHAARALFAERGYARTGVRDIAQAAGVSPQTVYDAIGSKATLVASLNDLIDAEAGVDVLVARMEEATDPREVLATSARVTAAIVGRCGDVLRALTSGAAAEPELAAALSEGARRHRAGADRVIARLAALQVKVHPGAAESLAILTDFRVALMMQDDYGWSRERIEAWLAEASAAVVLA